MRRLVLHLAVTCLTFLIGSAVSASYGSLTTVDSNPVESQDEITYISVDPPPELKILSGIDACGPTANFHTYFASDGAQLSTSCRHMAFPKRELKKRLANATEIIERRQELSEHGVVISERVVIRTSNGVASFLITDKSFCETTAPSMKHLQLLEKR